MLRGETCAGSQDREAGEVQVAGTEPGERWGSPDVLETV